MKRILLNRAERRGDVYYVDGQPFSGIGFERKVDGQVSASELLDGKIVRPYVSLCESEGPVQLRVDLGLGKADYEPTLYDGKPLSGMGYVFSNGFCVYEALFKGGTENHYIDWHETGKIAACFLFHDGYGEQYDWYDSGGMNECRIQTSLAFGAFFAFTEIGALKCVRLRDGAAGAIPKIAASSSFFPFHRLADIGQCKPDYPFSLDDNDFDDEILQLLIRSPLLTESRWLNLDGTKLTEASAAALGGLPKLEQLTFINPDGKQEMLARAVHNRRPDIQVTFNKVTIV